MTQSEIDEIIADIVKTECNLDYGIKPLILSLYRSLFLAGMEYQRKIQGEPNDTTRNNR